MKDILWARIESDIKAYDRNKRLARGGVAAFVLSALIAGSAFLGVNLIPDSEQSDLIAELEYETFSTRVGERSSIMLEDGSIIWLNSSSSITYPEYFQSDCRRVSISGEAYVEIARDTTRPFIISTSRMEVSVLGTKFNIADYSADESGSVVLVEGSVEVSTPAGEKVLMHPDERVRVDQEGVTVDDVCAADFAQWKDGFLRFKGETMEEVALQLSRFYGVSIKCSDRIASKKVSGRLVLSEDRDKVIKTFSIMYGTKVKYVNETLLLM